MYKECIMLWKIQAALQVIDREHYTEGFLKRRAEMKGHVRRKKPKSLKQFRAAAKESIQANQDAGCSAATILTEHMLNTMKVPAEEAMLSESRAFADVWGSEENRGMLHYFFVDERAKKIRPNFDGEPPRIETVGLVGAGWMGSEIARLAAGAGFQLRIYDADERCTQKHWPRNLTYTKTHRLNTNLNDHHMPATSHRASKAMAMQHSFWKKREFHFGLQIFDGA